jgi:hypothetical protein
MGWFLIALSAALALLEAILLIALITSGGKLSGVPHLIYPLLLAVSCGQYGRILLARSRNEMPASGGDSRMSPGGAPSGHDGLAGSPGELSVRYREACSQLSAPRPLIALALLAMAIWLIIIVGGTGKPGPQGFLFLLALVPGFYLFAVLLYLPYCIVLADGWLRVGARGVPGAGRVWRKQAIPLDAILCWDVVSMRELKAAKRIFLPYGNRVTGNMLGPGVRYACWLEADPARVRDGFPEQIMRHLILVDAAGQGYVRTGHLLIGTRHARALSRALEQALPGRRLRR